MVLIMGLASKEVVTITIKRYSKAMTTTALPVTHADTVGGERSADGDRFAVIIEPEIDFVRQVSRRFASRGLEPEDLTQEVLVKAFRGLDGFDGRYPRAWLRRIALNTAISSNRRNRFDEVPLGDTEPDALGPPTAAPTADQPGVRLMDATLDPVLETALRRLSTDHRRVVELVDLAEYTYDEAAAELGVPVGTVMSRVHRARHNLRSALAGTHLDRAGSSLSSTPLG